MNIQPEVLLAIVFASALLVFFVIGVLLSKTSKQGWKSQLTASIKAAKSTKVRSRPEAVAALITMDSLFDNLLKQISTGSTMGERLKAAKARFNKHDYNMIWEAHKVRNKVVHEPDNKINEKEIKSAAKTLADIALSYLSA